MAAPKVFCDDTPLPVLDRTRRRTRIARLWCYAVDDRPWQGPAKPAVVFRYAEDRRGRHVKEHLEDFHGVLQVDGCAGYGELTEANRPRGAVTLAFAWRMRGGSSSRCTSRRPIRSPPKRCAASARSTRSRRASAA